MPDPAQSIFISHTHADQGIADAIRDAVRALFGDGVAVSYSTNKELDGGIKPGDDWYGWIGKQVREAKAALILLTPASIQKPWVLWEAGAVAGATLAADGGGNRKLCPISFRIRSSDIPSPFGRAQITDGLDKDEVARLFEDLAGQFGLSQDRLLRVGKKLEPACKAYLDLANAALRTAPLLVTEAAVQEWLERLDNLKAEGRLSEIDELHDWLDVAFGRGSSENERPLDLRIHRRLGELYASAKNSKRAAREFDLARQLAPRDIYVLRRLGKAYLDDARSQDADNVIKTIEELDGKAFVRNAENAALKARWYSDQKLFAEAAAVLKPALAQNPKSHYLADLLGQAQLLGGQGDEARTTYSRVLGLIMASSERSIWMAATGLTASLVVGDHARQIAFLGDLEKSAPTGEQAQSIRDGVEKIGQVMTLDPDILRQLDIALGLRRRAIP